MSAWTINGNNPSLGGDNVFTSTNTFQGQTIITGVTNGVPAAAGKVGEIISQEITSVSGVALTTTVNTDVATVALSPGNWRVTGFATFTAAANTVVVNETVFLGTASGNNTTGRVVSKNTTRVAGGANTNTDSTALLPTIYVDVSVSANFYLKANATFSVSALSCYGILNAERRM